MTVSLERFVRDLCDGCADREVTVHTHTAITEHLVMGSSTVPLKIVDRDAIERFLADGGKRCGQTHGFVKLLATVKSALANACQAIVEEQHVALHVLATIEGLGSNGLKLKGVRDRELAYVGISAEIVGKTLHVGT